MTINLCLEIINICCISIIIKCELSIYLVLMMTRWKVGNLNLVLKNDPPDSIRPFRSTQNTVLKVVNIQNTTLSEYHRPEINFKD